MISNFLDLLILIFSTFLISEFFNISNNGLYYLMFLFLLLIFYFSNTLWFSNFFSSDPWNIFFSCLILILFLIILNIIEDNSLDIYSLFFLVLVGSIIIIMSENLLMVYLGLELQTFSLFVLISSNSNSVNGSEAGLNYFILGALSSGIFLLSLCILFVFGYNFNVNDLVLFSNEYVIMFAFSLLLLSLCFNLALFPLHFWIPDIYEGSSWDVITLLSTLPNISVICFVSQIILNSNMLLWFSLLSITIGTIGALNQSNFKRLLAYSGISHIGFIILGYNIICVDGYNVSQIYLMIYMSMMISVFVLIFCMYWNKDYYIIELSGLHHFNNLLALTWILLFLSIAGIPPLSGFLSNWFLIWNIIENDYLCSSLIAILFSAIGAGYYLSIVNIIYFQKINSYLVWNSVLSINNEFDKEINFFLLGLGVYAITFLILNFAFFISLINFFLLNIY